MAPDTAPPEREATRVKYYRPVDPAVAAEYDSFIVMMPQLRESHPGEYVAVRGGRVIASGNDLDAVLKRARVMIGAAPFYCGWIEPPGGSIVHFGSPSISPETDPR
jgi:hypothetical protein